MVTEVERSQGGQDCSREQQSERRGEERDKKTRRKERKKLE